MSDLGAGSSWRAIAVGSFLQDFKCCIFKPSSGTALKAAIQAATEPKIVLALVKALCVATTSWTASSDLSSLIFAFVGHDGSVRPTAYCRVVHTVAGKTILTPTESASRACRYSRPSSMDASIQ